jgi:hypothetical protein
MSVIRVVGTWIARANSRSTDAQLLELVGKMFTGVNGNGRHFRPL